MATPRVPLDQRRTAKYEPDPAYQPVTAGRRNGLREMMHEYEGLVLLCYLEAAGWKASVAARELGVCASYLSLLIKKHGIIKPVTPAAPPRYARARRAIPHEEDRLLRYRGPRHGTQRAPETRDAAAAHPVGARPGVPVHGADAELGG